jgi:glycerol kinase
MLRRPQKGPVAVKNYIGAVDQGTTSTRFMVFDRSARIAAVAQKEHEQIDPKPGWVEHDPLEILRRKEESGRSGELAGTRKLRQ